MDQPKYHIDIFWSDEDGGYIANVPDLRYCSAFGETYEEALREVLVAMELHLDTLKDLDRPIPEPTSHQESEIEVVGHYRAGPVVRRTAHYVLEYPTDEVAGSAGQQPREAAGEALDAVRDAAEQTMEAISEAAGQALENARESVGSVSKIDLAVLTHREREVLELVARGLNNRQIARQLHLSTSTINRQVRSALKALSAARAVDESTLRTLRRLRPQ